MKHSKILILMVIVICLTISGQVQAESKFGLKAGAGFGPDQFVFGAQYSLTESLGIFQIIPNVEFGFGNNSSMVLNVDFIAMFRAEKSSFAMYAGGAPTLNFADYKELYLGLTGVVGTQVSIFKNTPTNLELRLGITKHAPDVRILLAFLL